jgi:ABC-type glycerol-3-phosphate transport system permease component
LVRNGKEKNAVAQVARPVGGDGHPVAREVVPRQRNYRLGRSIGVLLTYLVLAIGAVLLLFPLYWLVSTSLKPTEEISAYPIIWVPSRLEWGNYGNLFNVVPFWSYLRNSLFIATVCTIGTAFSSSLVGFSFARLRYPGRNLLFVIALSTLMVPGWVTLIPQFIMFKDFGWLDSFKPLIIPQLFANPAYLFLLRQFFLTLPYEIEDAAKIDGCGYFRIYWNIALPLVTPALIAVAVFTFLYNWNDFLGPLIYLQSPDRFTLPLGLAGLQSQYNTHFELIMAGATLTAVPCIVLFFICQRWFIQGIVISGVKG